jgi:hypothetical protein
VAGKRIGTGREDTNEVEISSQPSARERAEPASLWAWAWVVAVAGVVLRVIWFLSFEHDLAFAYDGAANGHRWALLPELWAGGGDAALSTLDVTRAFSPGYGLLLRGIVEAAGGVSAAPHTVAVALLIVQSSLAAAATLLTFALARRVLFGWSALLPPLLLTASVALLELPGGLAPSIPLMFLLVLAVWLAVLLHERTQGRAGAAAVLLALAAGLVLGAALLFSPAVLLVAPLVLWWAFRGVGREYATLLLVATILLPASWIVVADTLSEGALPVEQVSTWAEPGRGNVAADATGVLDRAWSVATPWNARFARGAWASRNWNYEWLVPLELRRGATYIGATRALAVLFMLIYLGLVIAGLVQLLAEGAGSAGRLIGLPVVLWPLATLVTATGNLLRLPILPFLAIAFTLGAVWAVEALTARMHEKRAQRAPRWT